MKETNSNQLRNLEKPPILLQLIALFLPFILTPAILWLISWGYGREYAVQLFSLGVISFFGLGKFIVFAPLAKFKEIDFKIFYSSYQLAGMVIYMDTMVGIIVSYNFHMLKKIFWIGPRLKRIQEDCYYLLRSSNWMRKFAILGVVLFVSFPISGTGAIGGALLAGLLGFSRRASVFWILIGATMGTMSLAYFKTSIKDFLEDPVVFFSTGAVMILLLIFFTWKMRRMIQEQRKLDEQNGVQLAE